MDGIMSNLALIPGVPNALEADSVPNQVRMHVLEDLRRQENYVHGLAWGNA